MKHNIGLLRLILMAFVALALGASPAAAGQPAAIVTGSGTARFTYTGSDMPPGPYPGTFKFVGIVSDKVFQPVLDIKDELEQFAGKLGVER